MPNSWKETLTNAMPEHLSDLLVPPERQIEKVVWPLSLLALRKCLQQLCLSRNVAETARVHSNRESNQNDKNIELTAGRPFEQSDSNNNSNLHSECPASTRIRNMLLKKKIKAKKRHEIERMGQLTARIANESGVKYIVDFGSGLGHLARWLAYGHNLNVCCLEKETTLTEQAKYR